MNTNSHPSISVDDKAKRHLSLFFYAVFVKIWAANRPNRLKLFALFFLRDNMDSGKNSFAVHTKGNNLIIFYSKDSRIKFVCKFEERLAIFQIPHIILCSIWIIQIEFFAGSVPSETAWPIPSSPPSLSCVSVDCEAKTAPLSPTATEEISERCRKGAMVR